MKNIVIAIFLASLPSVAVAQEMPESALTSYASFRKALLQQGWIPGKPMGAQRNDGTPMYEFREVVCGSSTCSADWVARNKRKFSIGLWRDDAGNLRVAPQIDWHE
jgi:hypothetical protein